MSAELFHQDEQMSEVLQQVSSQLRASLGNIHRALDKLAPPERRDADPDVDYHAALLCQSYYRILRLADNLADAVDLDAPGAARLTNGDIAGLCREVMERAEQPAELLGLRLAFQCGKKSHIIEMDSARLERLLLNLLSNAFKFTPKGGLVSLEVRLDPQNVVLSLSDTGCGIAPELLETVFDRYRFTQRLDPPPHGLGLGLPICRRIAREHGGSLLLTSREGEGTTVTVSLPNRRSAGAAMRTYVVELGGGYNRTLVELSDALPRQAFAQKFLD